MEGGGDDDTYALDPTLATKTLTVPLLRVTGISVLVLLGAIFFIACGGNGGGGGSDCDEVDKVLPPITQIIDATGDGAGNGLDLPREVAVDSDGNVYVSGQGSDNVFQITPSGTITQIIDATGDGAGNGLVSANGVAVDSDGNVYVAGLGSDNVFQIPTVPLCP